MCALAPRRRRHCRHCRPLSPAYFNLALPFPLLFPLEALSPKLLTNTFTQVKIIFDSGKEFVVSGSTLRAPGHFTVSQTSQGAAQLFAHIATYADADTKLPKGAITVFYDALIVKWSLVQTSSKAEALAKLIKSITHEPFAETDNRFPRSVDAEGKPVARAGAGSGE